MKKNKELILITIILFSIFINGCTSIPSRQGTVWEGYGHSYKIIYNYLSWTDAKLYAEELGGYLVTITSSGEQAFVESMISKDGIKDFYWLGGYRDMTSKFTWITNENFLYTNWNQNEPNNLDEIENRLMMYGVLLSNNIVPEQFGMWNDIRNDPITLFSDNFGFIIEWD